MNRYEFRSFLGRGGFGAVFEAWDEVLQRSVAIKIARRDRFDGTTGCRRFLEEARAAAKLKHPNIVTVFDSGSDEDGNPFVVYEIIVGESLSDRIKRQPLSQSDTLRIVITVALATHYAHKQGLIHRDLKPGNILVDSAGEPHVTDFGLAVDERSQRQLAGEVAGSPRYMSPEQWRGETQYLDGRTDIWSLGVILYELLGRRLPFTGQSHNELCNEILNREPKPLRQIDDSISPALEAICLKCLRKSIADRWSSAADVAAKLRDLASPEAPQKRRRLAKWCGAMAAVVGAVLLAVIAPRWIDRNPTREGIRPEPPSQPTSTVPEAIPQKPTPGKWFPLLSRPPEYLLWPTDERNSKRDFNDLSRELWLTCGESGLIKLGEAKADFELQLHLHQSPWTGDVGIFLGLSEDAGRDATVRRYQLIELSCPRDRKGQYVFLNRAKLTRNGKTIVDRSTPATARLQPILNQDSILRLIVTGGRLTSVQWNGKPIPELVDPSLEATFPAGAQDGPFGIALEHTSVVVRHAEFLIPSETQK